MPISRRALLSAAAAALALPEPAAAGRTAPEAPRHETLAAPRFGVASYSLRKFPLEETLAMCRTLRVRYISLKDVHLSRSEPLEAVAAARRRVEAAGLTILGGGTIYWKDPDEAAIRKDFDYARAAGMPTIVCGPAPATLDLVERLAREFDIRIAIHNHGPEDTVFPTPYEAHRAIASRDAHMGLCVDVGHTARAGKDPAQAIRDLGPRVFDVHLKDLRDVAVRGSDVECGRGVLDLRAILQALAAIGFTGHAALEHELDENDPLDGMRESLAYLRGLWTGLGHPRA